MKRKKAVTLTTAALALTMTVCGSSSAIAASELTAESKPATQYTIDANQEFMHCWISRILRSLKMLQKV